MEVQGFWVFIAGIALLGFGLGGNAYSIIAFFLAGAAWVGVGFLGGFLALEFITKRAVGLYLLLVILFAVLSKPVFLKKARIFFTLVGCVGVIAGGLLFYSREINEGLLRKSMQEKSRPLRSVACFFRDDWALLERIFTSEPFAGLPLDEKYALVDFLGAPDTGREYASLLNLLRDWGPHPQRHATLGRLLAGGSPAQRARAALDMGAYLAQGDREGARLLWQAQDTPRTLLYFARRDHGAEAVKACLAFGESPNEEEYFEQGNCVSTNPLSLGSHNAETVAALLAAGADPNVRLCDDRTPVHKAVDLAASRGKTGGLPIIAAHPGVDLNARDENGQTPLFYTRCNKAIASILLEAGADPALTDRWGRTPREAAMRKSAYHAECATFLDEGAGGDK